VERLDVVVDALAQVALDADRDFTRELAARPERERLHDADAEHAADEFEEQRVVAVREGLVDDGPDEQRDRRLDHRDDDGAGDGDDELLPVRTRVAQEPAVLFPALHAANPSARQPSFAIWSSRSSSSSGRSRSDERMSVTPRTRTVVASSSSSVVSGEARRWASVTKKWMIRLRFSFC